MTKDEMIQALGLVSNGEIQFDERDDDGTSGRYVDWSIVRYNGMRALEVGDGYGTVQFDLTRAELVALHAALTATLLTDER